jgi:hypothetical protein
MNKLTQYLYGVGVIGILACIVTHAISNDVAIISYCIFVLAVVIDGKFKDQ